MQLFIHELYFVIETKEPVASFLSLSLSFSDARNTMTIFMNRTPVGIMWLVEGLIELPLMQIHFLLLSATMETSLM